MSVWLFLSYAATNTLRLLGGLWLVRLGVAGRGAGACCWRCRRAVFSPPCRGRGCRQREMEAQIARLRQEQADIWERDYRTLRRTYADQAKLYHDLHNHIEAIYHCLVEGQTAQAMQYCEDLRTPVRNMARTVWTGDTAIDCLINSKLALAGQNRVETRVNIECPRNTDIRSMDLTTILGNLLDNALEAAENAPPDRRFLHLTIRRIGEMLVIKVENGYGTPPVRAGEGLQTAKADKTLHGWGLKSVASAAEWYEGTVTTDYADGGCAGAGGGVRVRALHRRADNTKRAPRHRLDALHFGAEDGT